MYQWFKRVIASCSVPIQPLAYCSFEGEMGVTLPGSRSLAARAMQLEVLEAQFGLVTSCVTAGTNFAAFGAS
eukprot:4924885-Amphidinium_carterae.2